MNLTPVLIAAALILAAVYLPGRARDERRIGGLPAGKLVCRDDVAGHCPLLVGYCVASKVNSADKFYLVIESVRPDTRHPRSSKVPALVDGAGGSSIA